MCYSRPNPGENEPQHTHVRQELALVGGCAYLTPPSSRQSGRVGAAGSSAFGKYNYVPRSFPEFFLGPLGSLWMAKQYRGVSRWWGGGCV